MATALGMTTKEVEKYSFLKGIQAAVDGNWSKAGLELECARALFATGRFDQSNPHAFPIPADVLEAPIDGLKRDLTVAAASGGGYLVDTQNLSFIEMLRNRSVLMLLGAQRLTGMKGNVSIPRQTASATAYWLANESTPTTESQPTFGQLAFTPKTAAAYTEISRLLLLQGSPSAEALVRSDLAETVALAIDTAGISGTGASGQPTGLLLTSGIGSVTGTSIAYAGILEFQSDVAAGNALSPTCSYACTPAIATLLKQRQRFASTDSPLWDGNIYDGKVEGFRAMSSNQIPSGTLIFGDWSRFIIAEWGELQVEINPFANFQAGVYGVRCMYTIDVGVRYPSAFSVATSVT